ncbi:sugar ABC transporter ATP-binding protein [Mycobacterium sp. NAZ190054]|uniref:sugar ABC transporter ATP-binding protein n=1 Tax=Mycobacterium sp. NAZ190054 TaxID=1747766 RepID=UPI0007915F2A|nr:sugar ABC transporter ATP-binding protein [Mycobacterium sp. NAZ190054]KWX67084.1 hypothetical protein ASJ79_23025 [Mycobacterium sp. NAZ190054]
MHHISKRYGATQSLNDVSLSVAAGSSHALVGRNGAGKSTLVGVLTGMVEPDAGTIEIEGKPTTAQQRRSGEVIGCVFQRPQILPHLTVAENLLLGSTTFQTPVRWRRVHRKAKEILDDWGVPARPGDLARDLSVEQRQIVEIARTLARGSRVVILDEPTAQLDRTASTRLFERITQLQDRGVTFVFISHHLHEIWEVCDEATVLRDGRLVASHRVADISPSQLVSDMVGDGHTAPAPAADRLSRPVAGGTPALAVTSLSGAGFQDIDLEVAEGEILGVTGLSGSGKSELAETIAGLRSPTSGSMAIGGRTWKTGRLDAAIAAGIGYVPADRHVDGFVPGMSIEENITATVTGTFGRGGWIAARRRKTAARKLADRLAVVPADLRTEVQNLSGGNQQKVVLGRALASTPSVLVLITPTAGVDIASKERIYALIDTLRRDGMAVLLVSDTLDELRLADRVVVLFQGRQHAEFTTPVGDMTLISAIEGVPDPESTDTSENKKAP